jgi:aldehyde dehydrogenase (NAD+)
LPVIKENNLPEGISCLIGDYKVGEMMTNDKRVPLISATGSIRMGKIVAQTVAGRLGRSLLELGGNNAIIVTPDADIKMTVIGAVLELWELQDKDVLQRRLIIHESIYDKVKDAVVLQLSIGNPLDENNHVGPLIDTDAVAMYNSALTRVVEGGKILVEGGVLSGEGYEMLRETCNCRSGKFI